MSKTRQASPSVPEQYCAGECGFCGKKIGATLGHYQGLRCGRCGHYFWALQPKRNGPLVLFPQPRLNRLMELSRQEA